MILPIVWSFSAKWDCLLPCESELCYILVGSGDITEKILCTSFGLEEFPRMPFCLLISQKSLLILHLTFFIHKILSFSNCHFKKMVLQIGKEIFFFRGAVFLLKLKHWQDLRLLYKIDQTCHQCRGPFPKTHDYWLSSLCLNNSFVQVIFLVLNQNLHFSFIELINMQVHLLILYILWQFLNIWRQPFYPGALPSCLIFVGYKVPFTSTTIHAHASSSFSF